MAKKSRRKLLSLIVPAYKKEKTILADLRKIKQVLEKIRYDYEMIVVVDGQVDKTFQQAKKTAFSKIKVYQYQHNKGKGYAIRYGMARTKGELIAFIDAGMEIDPNGISMALEHMEWYQADIILGSKRHPASQVNYPFQRKVLSFLYQRFVRLFTGLNVRDTQAGLKIYRREVLEKVLPRLLVKRYAIDLEILVVAHHLGFKKIYEAPIKLNYDFEDIHASNLFGANGMHQSLMDTLAIIYRLRILHYYDDNSKRKWRYDPDLNFKVNIG